MGSGCVSVCVGVFRSGCGACMYGCVCVWVWGVGVGVGCGRGWRVCCVFCLSVFGAFFPFLVLVFRFLF